MNQQSFHNSTPAAAGPGRQAVLSARDIVVEYRASGRSPVRAVRGVSLDLFSGETLGVVGESGCGKSSLGRSLVQLPPPTSGQVHLGDEELTRLSQRQLRGVRRKFQLVFQDPISSLNPRRTALEIVADPLRLAKHPRPVEAARAALAGVGVDAGMADRRPHQLSGGQCQRVSIARAVVQNPEILICDEPVSALDVSVQAAVLNLLETMKEKHGLSMIFISHDLAVVKNISDRIAVMYLGRICEVAPATELYERPLHHYTRLLLDAIPNPTGERRRQSSPSEVSRRAPSEGCPFAPRCAAASDLCRTITPDLTGVGQGREVACHHPIAALDPTARSA